MRIDGEVVVLGIDGVADFNALHGRKHDHDVQLNALLALDSEGPPRHAAGHNSVT
jgi:hypothetical protein